MTSRISDGKSVASKVAKPTLCLLASLALAQSAVAGGPLGASAGVGVGAQVGAGAIVPRAGVSAGANARADVPAPSARALENSNGQVIEDRKFGLDRARERLSEEGAEHQKATEAVKKKAARASAGGSGASSETSAQSSTSAATSASRQ